MNEHYNNILMNVDKRFKTIQIKTIGCNQHKEDILQEFYFRFIKYKHLFMKLKDNQIYYYSAMVLKQISVDFSSKWNYIGESDIDIGYESDIEQKIDNQIIMNGLSILTFYERELIKLYYFDYLTYREMSELTLIPITSLNLTIRKAIKKIQKHYGIE